MPFLDDDWQPAWLLIMNAPVIPRLRLVLMLLALPFITASQCVVLFSSGDNDDKDKDDEEIVVVARQGNLMGTPVEGLAYRSGAEVGVTGPGGVFSYVEGELISFALGDIELGAPVDGKAVIAPRDLIPGGTNDTPAVINIARLLQSLDADPGEEIITIPPAVLAAAVRDNPAVSTAIAFLDFADETAFSNAASQLVAVLTADYPFTASLVDGDTARARLLQTDGPSATLE